MTIMIFLPGGSFHKLSGIDAIQYHSGGVRYAEFLRAGIVIGNCVLDSSYFQVM